MQTTKQTASKIDEFKRSPIFEFINEYIKNKNLKCEIVNAYNYICFILNNIDSPNAGISYFNEHPSYFPKINENSKIIIDKNMKDFFNYINNIPEIKKAEQEKINLHSFPSVVGRFNSYPGFPGPDLRNKSFYHESEKIMYNQHYIGKYNQYFQNKKIKNEKINKLFQMTNNYLNEKEAISIINLVNNYKKGYFYNKNQSIINDTFINCPKVYRNRLNESDENKCLVVSLIIRYATEKKIKIEDAKILFDQYINKL